MDTTTDTTTIDPYVEALENVPEEVRDMLWSDTYQNIVGAIANAYTLSDAQKNVVSSVVRDSIINAIQPEEAVALLASAGINPDDSAAILTDAYQYVATPVIKRVDAAIADDAESDPETSSTPNAPSPLEAIASIQAQLKQATTVAPIVRNVSIEKPTALDEMPVPMAPRETAAPRIDPYREIPE